MSENPAKKPRLMMPLHESSVSMQLPSDIKVEPKYLIQIDEANKSVLITIPPSNLALKPEMTLIATIVTELNVCPREWKRSIVRLIGLTDANSDKLYEGGTEYQWQRSNPSLKTIIVVKKAANKPTIPAPAPSNKGGDKLDQQRQLLQKLKQQQRNPHQIIIKPPPKPIKPAIRNPLVRQVGNNPLNPGIIVLQNSSNISISGRGAFALVDNPIRPTTIPSSNSQGIGAFSRIYSIPNNTCCNVETPVTSGRTCIPRRLKFKKSKPKTLFPLQPPPLLFPIPEKVLLASSNENSFPMLKACKKSTVSASIIDSKCSKYSMENDENNIIPHLLSLDLEVTLLPTFNPMKTPPSPNRRVNKSAVVDPSDEPPFKIIDWNKVEVPVIKDKNGRIYFSKKAAADKTDFLENYRLQLTNGFVFPHDNWNVQLSRVYNSSKRVLGIYELNNSYEPLTILRSIQMFSDGTINVIISGKDCTEEFLKKISIENIDDVKELIQLLSTSKACAGSIGFDIVAVCENAVRRGKVWYSEECRKVIFTSSDSTCNPCQLVRNILRIEKAKIYRQVQDMEQEHLQEVISNSEDKKPEGIELGRAIYDLIGGFWEELKIEEESKKLSEEIP